MMVGGKTVLTFNRIAMAIYEMSLLAAMLNWQSLVSFRDGISTQIIIPGLRRKVRVLAR